MVVPSCAKAAGSGSQIAAALAARVTAALSQLLAVASLSAAAAIVKQATVQQSNVSTTQPQSELHLKLKASYGRCYNNHIESKSKSCSTVQCLCYLSS